MNETAGGISFIGIFQKWADRDRFRVARKTRTKLRFQTDVIVHSCSRNFPDLNAPKTGRRRESVNLIMLVEIDRTAAGGISDLSNRRPKPMPARKRQHR